MTYILTQELCDSIKVAHDLFKLNASNFAKLEIRLPFGLYIYPSSKVWSYNSTQVRPVLRDNKDTPKLKLITPLKKANSQDICSYPSFKSMLIACALQADKQNERFPSTSPLVTDCKSSSDGTEEAFVPHSLSTYFVLGYSPRTRFTMYFEQNLGYKLLTKSKIAVQTGCIVTPYKNTIILRKIVSSLKTKTLKKIFKEFVIECNKILFTHCKF